MFAKFTLIVLVVASLLVSACSSGATNNTNTMQGMDQGMMTLDPNLPYDAQFIDSMLPHHQGAVEMAGGALKNAEHLELKQLAESMITTQSQAIGNMQSWRQAWYPDIKAINNMDMAMGDMQMSSDAGVPFDQRFLQAMISHHQGAIEMAKMSAQMAEHPEIKTLSDAIIKAQQAELEQMQAWLKAWYG